MGISNADRTSYPWQDAVTLQYPATALNPKAERFQVSGGPKIFDADESKAIDCCNFGALIFNYQLFWQVSTGYDFDP